MDIHITYEYDNEFENSPNVGAYKSLNNAIKNVVYKILKYGISDFSKKIEHELVAIDPLLYQIIIFGEEELFECIDAYKNGNISSNDPYYVLIKYASHFSIDNDSEIIRTYNKINKADDNDYTMSLLALLNGSAIGRLMCQKIIDKLFEHINTNRHYDFHNGHNFITITSTPLM
jgi:hypothetical protein